MNSLVKEKLTAMQNAAVNRAVDAAIDKAEHKINVSTNTIVLAVLHDAFGFGRLRLLKFYAECAKYQGSMSERYGEDCDSYAMRRRLKEECGIDVEQLVAEAENDAERGKTVIDMSNVEAV